MKKPRIVLIGFLILGVGFVFYSLGRVTRSSAQSSEKSLDIRRHNNEPLELIDVKVSGRSIKQGIKAKVRRPEGGLDNVTFQETDGWPRRIRLRLRNVSDKTIVGLQAYLYLKPPHSPMSFSATLKGSKQLEQTILEPGDEIEAMVDEGSWERAVARIKQDGWDPNLAEVTFLVGIVAFSDNLLWNKGSILRRDPNNPNRASPIEEKHPPDMRRSHHLRDLRKDVAWGNSGVRSVAPQPFQSNAQCVLDNNSFIADHCVNDAFSAYCYKVTAWGAGPGTSSSFPVSGDCR